MERETVQLVAPQEGSVLCRLHGYCESEEVMRKVRLTKTFQEILACRDVYPVRDVAKHFSVSERRVKEIWRVRRETNTEPPNVEVSQIARDILVEDTKILLGRGMTVPEIHKFFQSAVNGNKKRGNNQRKGASFEDIAELVRELREDPTLAYLFVDLHLPNTKSSIRMIDA
jgi:hypothetical protein